MKRMLLGIIIIGSIFAISANTENSSSQDTELNRVLQFFISTIYWMSNEINRLKTLSNQSDSTYRSSVAAIKQYLSNLPNAYNRLKFQINRTKQLEKPTEFDLESLPNLDPIKKIMDDVLNNEPNFIDSATFSQIKPKLEKVRENYQDILDVFQSKYNISL